MFLVRADLTKAVFPAERATGLVERKNAREQFPQSQALRFADEPSEQSITHASTPPIAMDVHRKFADAPITSAFPVRSSRGPTSDFGIDLGNNGGITTSNGLKPCSLIFCRWPVGFISGNAVLDALIVDFSNRCSVI